MDLGVMETKVIVMLQQLHLSYLLVIMEPNNQHVHSTSLRNSSTRISVHFGVNRELRTTLEAKKGQGGGDFTVTSLGGCLEQLVSIIKSTQTRRHSLKLAPTPPSMHHAILRCLWIAISRARRTRKNMYHTSAPPFFYNGGIK